LFEKAEKSSDEGRKISSSGTRPERARSVFDIKDERWVSAEAQSVLIWWGVAEDEFFTLQMEQVTV